jgi:acyl-CoA synthetase (AMP-forming)/AMP-acid ligase II
MGIIDHGSEYDQAKRPPSLLSGPTSPPLLNLTLGDLLDIQADRYPSSPAIICPDYQNTQEGATRWTYSTLQQESLQLGRGFQSLGLKSGERIGVLAGNCAEYLSLFFAAAYTGVVLVVLNNTYTKEEAKNALRHSGCRFLFTMNQIGRIDMGGLLEELGPRPKEQNFEGDLISVVMLKGSRKGFLGYEGVKSMGSGVDEESFKLKG